MKTVFQPASAHDHRYTIIFKFDRLSHFHRWEEAVERHEWNAQVRAFQRAEPRMRVLTGLETWLTCPAHSTSAPSRHRMTLITWLAAFLLLTGLYLLFGSILSQMPLLLRTLLCTLQTRQTHRVFVRFSSMLDFRQEVLFSLRRVVPYISPRERKNGLVHPVSFLTDVPSSQHRGSTNNVSGVASPWP
jgi:hypothetical protein